MLNKKYQEAEKEFWDNVDKQIQSRIFEKEKFGETIMEKKKLTDEEIAQALLQNIEYSKTLTYFDKWGNHKAITITDIIAFINRLQDDKQKVVQDYYCERQTCDEQKDIIAKQKAEIERLTEGNEILKGNTPLVVGRSLGKTIRAKLLAFDRMKEQNAELQKQVDELKKDNARLDKNVKWHQEKIENGELVSNQAVKETAKEILGMFDDRNYISESELKKAIVERYGVEVE